MRALASALVAGALLASAVGCSSFGSDDPAPTDASTATPADAGDAGPLPPPTCPLTAAFCDAFERDDVQGAWTSFVPPPSSGTTDIVLSLDATKAVTGARSLHVTDQGLGGTGGLQLDVSKNEALSMSFDLRVGALSERSTILANFFLNKGVTAVNIALTSQGLELTDQLLVTDGRPNNFSHGPIVNIPLDTWMRVVFTIEGGSSKLDIPSLGIHREHVIANPSDNPRLARLGITYRASASTRSPLDVWYDDVVVAK